MRSRFLLLIRPLPLKVIKDDLAHAHALWRYFHVFVGLDVLQCFLKREDSGRNDVGLLVGAACTDIGELLCLADIDDDIVFMNVLTNNLTSIDLILRLDEEAAPVLQMIDGIGVGITTLKSNK